MKVSIKLLFLIMHEYSRSDAFESKYSDKKYVLRRVGTFHVKDVCNKMLCLLKDYS